MACNSEAKIEELTARVKAIELNLRDASELLASETKHVAALTARVDKLQADHIITSNVLSRCMRRLGRLECAMAEMEDDGK